MGSSMPSRSIDFLPGGFVIGGFNRLAATVTQAAIDRPGGHYNPVILWAGSGLGKTTLLRSVSDAVRGSAFVIHLSCGEFLDQLFSAARNKLLGEYLDVLCGPDYLLIDDVQLLRGKEQVQHALLHVIRCLAAHDRQVILTTSEPLSELPVLDTAIRRMDWAVIADIQPPGPEARREIVRRKAASLGFDLSALMKKDQ